MEAFQRLVGSNFSCRIVSAEGNKQRALTPINQVEAVKNCGVLAYLHPALYKGNRSFDSQPIGTVVSLCFRECQPGGVVVRQS